MKKIKNILILAGGNSTRFWPFKNKSYLNFLGHPLIVHLLDQLKDLTNNVFVIINPAEKHLTESISTYKSVTFIEQTTEIPGQAGAILSAKDKLQGEVLILNANDMFDFNYLKAFMEKIENSKPDFLFFAKKVKDYFPGGYLKFKGKKISSIVEKPDYGQEPSDFVKLVVDYFADIDTVIKAIEELNQQDDDLYEQALTKLISTFPKTDFIVYDSKQPWLTIKYPWHVLLMMDYFLKSLDSEKIFIGKNVKIAKTAKIVGPCYIGDNTTIGDFAMVRECHIGKNCLIGGYSEVTRSYIGDNTSLHRNYVGDSVIGDNVLLGAQAATANFRFDGKIIKSEIKNARIDTNLAKLGAIIGSSSKIGVNSTILPGIKIGSNSLIGPGEVVTSDIPNSKFIFKGRVSDNKK